MGCLERTFSGLAGIGDLIVTATSVHSRNNRAGKLIGRGLSPAEAVREVGMVVEGMNALPAAMALSRRHKVELPIIEAVNRIVNENARPEDIVSSLMRRERKNEVSKPRNSDENGELPDDKPETDMKRVLLPGAFGRLEYSDVELLRKAKALGDYLIVAMARDKSESGLDFEKRKALLEAVRYVDLVVEDTDGDIRRLTAELNADVLAVTRGASPPADIRVEIAEIE
jgi:hypothetical protein